MSNDLTHNPPRPIPEPVAAEIRAGLVRLTVAALAWGGLAWFPSAEMAVFARGTANLASLLTGSPVERTEAGWLLAGTAQPVVVSTACSATGYFLVVVALLGWRLAPFRLGVPRAMLLAAAVALPVTLFVNALRVVVVMHAHRWVIPRLPGACGPFLHMLAGVAIFLPALIGLNLLLEYHGNHRPR